MERTARKMQSIGKKMSIGLTAPILIAGKLAFDELKESEAVAAQTNAALKSTGNSANVSAQQVSRFASEKSRMSGIDDELIQSGQNLMLTFKNVANEAGKGNDVFTRANTAALDLSVAGFGDLTSTSKMLGKALNDPIAGMTALSKAGVTFTQGQKDTIRSLVESGDLLGAQKFILKEVESQVGGSAKAYGETLPGQVGKAKEALLSAAGAILSTASPAFDVLTGAAEGFAGFMSDLPGPVKGVVAALTGVVAIAGPALYVIGGMVRNFKSLQDAMPALNSRLAGFRGGLAGIAGSLGLFGAIIGGSILVGSAMADQGTRAEELKNRVANLNRQYEAEVELNGRRSAWAQKLKGDLDGAKGDLEDYTSKQEKANTSTLDSANALIQQGNAAKLSKDQLRALGDESAAIVNSQLGLEGALLNVEGAILSANQATTDYGAGSLEARNAQQGLATSIIAAGEAAKNETLATTTGVGEKEKYRLATDAQIFTLMRFAENLDGPQKQAVLDEIARLQELGRQNPQPSVGLNTWGFRISKQKIHDDLIGISRSWANPATGTTGASLSIGFDTYAEGGWVRGTNPNGIPAMVHPGEFVINPRGDNLGDYFAKKGVGSAPAPVYLNITVTDRDLEQTVVNAVVKAGKNGNLAGARLVGVTAG